MSKNEVNELAVANDGIGFEVENELYHQMSGISSTDIKVMKLSPLHYLNKELFKFDTDSLTRGSLYHKMVLEPDTLKQEFIKEDFEGAELNKNSKAYKEAKAEFLKQHQGKKIITKNEWEETEKMSLITKTIAGALLENTVNERAFFWENEEFGELLKCKVDALNLQYGVAIDLKTISGDVANEKDIQRAVLDYKYHISAAFYLDILNANGLDINSFVLIFQSTQKPYYCLPYLFSNEAIELGRKEYRDTLERWKRYKENGEINVVRKLNLPDWYINKVVGGEL